MNGLGKKKVNSKRKTKKSPNQSPDSKIENNSGILMTEQPK